VRDPESLPGLVRAIPESDSVPEIEYAYDVTPRKSAPRKDFVFCAHCGYPTHYKGYVVKYESCRCLIGKDCGFKLYGADFHAVERGFIEERRRQINLLRLDAAVEGFPHLLRSLGETANASETKMFDRARVMMRTNMPDLWSALSGLADGSSDLIVNEQARDYAAEQARDQRRGQQDAADDEVDEPIFTFVSKIIGPLNGAAFCRPNLGSAVASFQREHDRLKQEYQRFRSLNTSRMSTRQIGNELSGLRTDLEQLLVFERPMRAVASFFGPANLLRIAEWANHTTRNDTRYGVQGMRLLAASHGQPAEVSFPQGYKPPDLTGLQSFLTKLGLDD